jgi:hypothetical protein
MAQQTFEELVAAVKQAESRGKRYADDGKTLTTSAKGALGEMQVMPKTILDPGFGVTPARDKSPDEIARVGVDYLQAMKQKYGDTEKALIAYNWGPGSTDKWLAAGADPKKLPAETRTYVERVKGFLGSKDVPRETSVAKKEREPLPPSLPPMAQAKPEAAARVASLGPGYQAALALSFLAETDDEEDRKTTITQEYLAKAQEEEDDRAATAAIAKRQANVFADLSNTTIRSPFAEPQQPVMMKDGGDVSAEQDRLTPQQIERIAAQGPTERKDEPFFDAASRTYVDVLTGRREPITAKDFTAKEQMAMMDAVRRSQARGGKGRVDYEDYPTGDQIGPDYVDIRNTLGGFQYKQGPDGSTIILDKYDFHGPRVAEYEKMGTGEKLVKSAKNALTEFVKGGFSPRDLAGELGRAYVGSKGPDVNIRIPVNRAEGSPKEGERKLDRETMDMLRRQGTSPASLTRVAPPADISSSAAGLPGLMLLADPRIDQTNAYGYVLDSSDDKKNFGMAQAMFLNKSRSEDYPDTIAHETEHLLARQNLGSAASINSKFDELIGNKGISRLNFVRDAVKAAPYLKEKYDLQSSYLDPKMFEYQSKFGLGKNLLYEQLASLAALEQRHKIDLTKDPELRKTLFSRPDVRETYNALTGLRQTRLDPRDLPPHTRVAEPGMLDAIKGVFKRAEGGPVYRAEGSPEEGERLTPQQIERIAAQEAAEREAASTPAFIAQKSGIGRKAGPVSQALQSGQGQIEFLKGMTNVPQNILGAPMDISNMIANVYGGGVEKPFMGSEYIKEGLRSKGLGFTPSTDPTLAAFYGVGDLGSNLVNPAGVTRAGVKAAEKTGEAAKMLARDFQGYNQQLAAPGASYAMKPKGGHYYVWPESSRLTLGLNPDGTLARKVIPEKSQVDAYLDKVAAQVTGGMNRDNVPLSDWVKSKVGRYIRSDFATEQDQMVQAAEQGKKLHFTSPKAFEEGAPIIDPSLTIMRKTEGFPKEGFAKTGQGKLVEDIVDSSVWPATLDNTPTDYIPSSIRGLKDTDPNMRIYEFPDAVFEENLKMTNLVTEMDKMMTEKTIKLWNQDVPVPREYQLDADTLKGLTPAQASNRVAMKEEWLLKKEPEVAGQALAKDPQLVSHRYDNGSKWISPADLSENDMHRQMVNSIGCRAGWCTDKDSFALDYGSGDNRLHILLDKGFQPRAQLTMSDRQGSLSEFLAVKVAENPNYNSDLFDNLQNARASGNQQAVYDAMEEFSRLPEYLDWSRKNNIKQITEIKGQFNKEDLTNQPYLKEVQDFVKRQGPELQSVENLDGIGMTDISSHIYPNKAFKAISAPGKKGMKDVYEEAIKINGNSAYIEDDPAIIDNLIEKAVKNVFTPKLNEARTIQMNLFQPPTEKALGGMIERQPNDNRRYM